MIRTTTARRQRRHPRAAGERVHGDVGPGTSSAFEPVFALVRAIPRGRVMTYGQIATLLYNRLSPRAVGWALHGCPKDVPWQRVINASGGFSTERLPDIPPGLQRALLEAEGVALRANGTVDLDRYRWAGPPTARPRARSKASPATGAARGGTWPARKGAGPSRKR